MDDYCFDANPVFVNADGLVDTPSNYFSSKTKYCLVDNTSYRIFKDWRVEGERYSASNPSAWKWNSGWKLTCRRENTTRSFYQDNSGANYCPDKWSYVTKTNSSGWFTHGTSQHGTSAFYWTASCSDKGSDVWYR